MRKTLLFGTLAGLAVLAFSLPAAAEPAQPAPLTRVAVEHGDLDVETVAGAATLHQRIVSAAKSACRRPAMEGARSAMAARSACFREAVHETVAAIGSDALWEKHLATFGWAAAFQAHGAPTSVAEITPNL